MRALNLISILSYTILIIQTASAEDRLKPVLDSFYNAISAIAGWIGNTIFSLFPSLNTSIKGILNSIDKILPFMRDFHWLIYVLLFVAIIAILVKLLDMSKAYIINSISGILLLLILIHIFGVEIKVSLLVLIFVVLFGIPGVLFLTILHYLGIFL